MQIEKLVQAEGWKIVLQDNVPKIFAYGKHFPLSHPFWVHALKYRTEQNPDIKFMHMKAMHDYMWPKTIWHYWVERRFREHCEGWQCMTWAGGASTAKSFSAAQIALLFWLGNPTRRTVIVASTTLESLSSRVWGYTTQLLRKSALEGIPFIYKQSPNPKILWKSSKVERGKSIEDTIHGLYALAAKTGEDERVIAPWIGRHPDEGLMMIIDECTDMPPALLKAIPNLENTPFLQIIGIGNSNSKNDLHGLLSTPKNGWGSVSPDKDIKWETNQKKGICLYFDCYESPAIFEKDPVRKKALGKFLPTAESIAQKEAVYGKDSDGFWRFGRGFWRAASTDNVVVSEEFIKDFRVFDRAEWSGFHPLHICAGLDPAFSTGGDQCVLRLAVLGHTTSGQMVLDFRQDKLLFHIPIIASGGIDAGIQIATKVVEILKSFDVPVRTLCVDATGQGRALGGVIQLMSNGLAPIKIYSTRQGNRVVNSFDCIIKTAYEMWFDLREFIQHGQIKGLDAKAIAQLTSRQVMKKPGGVQYLEKKIDFKNRMMGANPILAHSPDEADAASLCLQSAIISYGFSLGESKRTIKVVDSFSQKMAALQHQKLEEKETARPFELKSDFTMSLEDFASLKGSPFE